jgi:hypothetical protein
MKRVYLNPRPDEPAEQQVGLDPLDQPIRFHRFRWLANDRCRRNPADGYPRRNGSVGYLAYLPLNR